jgi:atypical dual specificity phosphatase
MSEIIPHVYLSSVVYAKDSYWLKKNKITHILTIGNLESYFPDKFKYKRIQIEDKPESNIK